jgi:4-hydroxymandelate oxidase
MVKSMMYQQPALDRIPSSIASVDDYIPYARERIEPSAWAYLTAAAADGHTAGENVAALQRLQLLPNVLCSGDQPGTQVDLPGGAVPYPVMLAPVAYQRLAHPDGELATALGASAMQAGMVVSAQASHTLEDIAARASSLLWFQLYTQPEFDDSLALVQRAEAAGYKALVVTLDAPLSGLRNAEQRAGFALPPDVRAVNLPEGGATATLSAQAGQALSGPLRACVPGWETLARLTAQTRLPVLAKGILHPDDARRAIDAGCQGIIVSNHGGRVLDTVPATIAVLPAVVAAAGLQVPVLMDGGIRRGTDILKALALGARAVMVGRPQVYGLAAAGASGVAHVLHILRTELEMAMLLSGRTSIQSIDASVLWSPGCAPNSYTRASPPSLL